MIRKLLAGALALAGLIITGITFLPRPFQEIPVKLTGLSNESGPDPLNNREVLLRYSTDLITGEPVMFEMSLLPAPPPQSSTMPVADYLEARLDLPGVDIFPDQTISAPDQPAQTVSFRWLITAGNAEPLPGRVWLTVVSAGSNGGETRQPAMARPLEMRLFRVLGLPIPEARWLGGGLTGIGLIFLFVLFRSYLRLVKPRAKLSRSSRASRVKL